MQLSGRLMQRSGFAAMIGGVLLPIYQVIHPERDAQSVLQAPYALIHLLGVIALVHILFGLAGLGAALLDKLGRRGIEAFILAFFRYGSLGRGADG